MRWLSVQKARGGDNDVRLMRANPGGNRGFLKLQSNPFRVRSAVRHARLGVRTSLPGRSETTRWCAPSLDPKKMARTSLGPSEAVLPLSLAEHVVAICFLILALHEAHVWFQSPIISGVYSTRDEERGGIAEYYGRGEFRALEVYVLLSPAAVIAILHSTFMLYRSMLGATRAVCGLVAGVLAVDSGLCVYAMLRAQRLADRNNLWGCGVFSVACDIDDDYHYQQSGLVSVMGLVEFFVFAFFGFLCLPLALTAAARTARTSADDAPPFDLVGSGKVLEAKPLLVGRRLPTRKGRSVEVLACVAGALVVLLTFASASLLPTTFEQFVPSAVSSYVKSRNKKQWNDSTSAGWRLVLNVGVFDAVTFKFWPDLLMWYGYVAVVAGAGVASLWSNALRRHLSKRVLTPAMTVGEAAFWALTALLFVGLTIYWLRRPSWGGVESADLSTSELWARILGQLANATMGLVVLPVSRNSIWTAYVGLGWEAIIRFHALSGGALVAEVVAHSILWYWAERRDLKRYPLGFDYPYPNARNWTVPLMIVVSVAMFLAMGLLVRVRRSHWEVFKWTHHIALAVFVATLWHANMAWYYLVAGLTLYLVDRYLRFAKAAVVASTDFELVSASCLDSVGVDDAAATVVRLEYRTEHLQHEAGQLAWIHVAEVSLLEWHPFTLSSSPGDATRTHHIKVRGDEGSWTRRLADVVRQRGADGLTLSVDGPYGTPPGLRRYDRVLFVAGGIGVTPIASILAELLASEDDNEIFAARLLWIAKSRRLFDIFADRLRLADLVARTGAVGLSASLFETAAAADIDKANASANEDGLRVARGRPDLDAEFRAFAPDSDDVLCFVCGPPELVDAASRAAFRHGVDFHAETFEL